MTQKRIAIGSDHAGFSLKEKLREDGSKGVEWVDCGTYDESSVDYPDFAEAVCQKILNNETQLGVLVCSTGVGISIAANRHKGIRAALCTDATMARLCREHNDANVLVLGAKIIGTEVAAEVLDVFLKTPFSEGERHQRRICKLDN
jgi:ribose 5-phosphate isomerase B